MTCDFENDLKGKNIPVLLLASCVIAHAQEFKVIVLGNVLTFFMKIEIRFSNSIDWNAEASTQDKTQIKVKLKSF